MSINKRDCSSAPVYQGLIFSPSSGQLAIFPNGNTVDLTSLVTSKETLTYISDLTYNNNTLTITYVGEDGIPKSKSVFFEIEAPEIDLEATAPLSYSAGVLSIPKSSLTVDGYLSKEDFDFFSSKADSSSIPTLTSQLTNDSNFITLTDLPPIDAIPVDGSSNAVSSNGVFDALASKQASLVSGTNIKTVNGNSLLGSGDVTITTSTSWGSITGTITDQTDLITYVSDADNITSGTLSSNRLESNISLSEPNVTVGFSAIASGATGTSQLELGTDDAGYLLFRAFPGISAGTPGTTYMDIYGPLGNTWSFSSDSGPTVSIQSNYVDSIVLNSDATVTVSTLADASVGYVKSSTTGLLSRQTGIPQSDVTNLSSDLALKAPLASPTFTGTVVLPSTTSVGSVSSTEIGYLDGVTSALQGQIDGKQAQLNGTGFVKVTGTTVSYDNSTYLTTASAASTYQPLDSDLTTIAGLTATTDNFIVSVASAWASRTPAQVKTTLSLNNVENTALSTWAGSTNITTLGTISTGTVPIANVGNLGTGIATFLATPSSANLAAAVTGETGTGALVFGTSPDFTTGITIGGVAVPTISSASVLTNKTISGSDNTLSNIAQSSVTNLTSDLALKAPLASPTFTGTVVLPSTTSIGSVTSTEIGYLSGVTSAIQTQLNSKQATLVSGTNIKTVNGTTLLGSGDLDTRSGNQFVFSGVAAPTYTQGKLVYDTDNESLTFFNNDSNVSLQIGQENWVRVRNDSGSSITNGSVVYISGTHVSGLPQISLAQANSAATTVATGLVTETIANNAIGYVTSIGLVRNLNTSAFADGAIVFLSASTPGALTSTAPSAPNYRYRVGIVTRSHASSGTIHVTPSTAALANGTANQVLGINNGGTAQEFKSITGDGYVSVTHGANSIALSTNKSAITAWWLPLQGSPTANSTAVFRDIQQGGGGATGTPTFAGGVSTNLFTSMPGVNINTGAVAASYYSIRTFNSNILFWRGNAAGLGGFDYTVVFGNGSAATVADQKIFVGLYGSGNQITSTTDPANLTNTIGCGADFATDTNLQIYHNDASGTATKVDLGSNFPITTLSTDVYQITLSCEPNASTVDYRVVRLNTGNVATGTLSTNLPSSGTFLNGTAFTTNGSTALAATLKLFKMTAWFKGF